MNYVFEKGIKAAVLTEKEKWQTVSDALDDMAAASYDGCVGVIVPKECLTDDFFDLRTGLAGEILQKYTNYKMKIAVTGDFSGYTSKSLRDFIYESNKGRQVFFKASLEDAMAAIARAMA